VVEDCGMDIAFVWSNIRRPIGGAEYFLIDFLNYIKSSKYPVSISVYDVNEGIMLIKELNVYDGVVIYSLNEALPLISLLRVPMLLDVHSPDWLWYFRERTYGISPTLKTKLKRLWIKILGKKLFCRVLNLFDYETLGMYCRRAFLLPNFVNTKCFRPTKSKSDEFTVLVRYDPSLKGGFDIFLKALRLLGKSRWLNIIMFGGDPPQYILNIINTYANYLTSLGKLPDRNLLIDIYSSAHATIIPSRYEGFPLIALESLACGTPIIMSKLPATAWFMKEITIKEPGTGLTFKSNNPVELALKIKFLNELYHKNNFIYNESTLFCRNVSLKFDISRIAPRYLNILYDMIQLKP
jgi:glycosyltransferase involved in cell wall biosynthesis